MPMNPDVAWAVEDVRKRADPLGLTRAYYDGRHRLTFATDKWRNAFGDLFREFADNLCDDVCDEPADRLQITNWTVKDADQGVQRPPITTSGRTVTEDGQPAPDMPDPDQAEDDAEDELAQAMTDWWTTVNGPARSGMVHLNGHWAGDGWAIVWPDSKGYPRFYLQRPEHMAIRYSDDDPDEAEVAAKVWRAGKVWRLTLYYPDRVERYATRGTGAQGGLPAADRFQELVEVDPVDGEVIDSVEFHDWGMPVHHFPREAVSGYGCSVLGDVIPLQDALNKSVADMLVAMEFHAMPQRWATGVEVQRDPVTGLEVDPFQAGAGKVWWTQKEGGQFGQFQQADLSGFLEVQASLKAEIGRKGTLPPTSTSVEAGSPTATGQVILEGRLVKRVKNLQRDWEPRWLALGAQALRMLGHGEVRAQDLGLEWAPPETRDEKALLESLTLKQGLGVPKRQLLLEAGYDSTEVRDFLDEGEPEGADDEAAVAAAMAGGRVSVPTAADLAAAAAAGLPAPEPLA